MAKGLAPMEVDNAASQRKLKKGLSSGKAAKKEMKQSLKREKKKLAKVGRNKKTAAEFSNHKPKASKNTMDHLAKNCQIGIKMRKKYAVTDLRGKYFLIICLLSSSFDGIMAETLSVGFWTTF